MPDLLDLDTRWEACDGVDNNCVDGVDEGYDVGEDCMGEHGVCATQPGTIECADEATTRCSTDPGGSEAADGTETCNGADDDCDGDVDEGCDDDVDGYCDDTMEVLAGATCDPGDCDDGVFAINPAAVAELCNGVDDDCDEALLPTELDVDGDGFLACDAVAADCDDEDDNVYPGADEICDGKNSDCDAGGVLLAGEIGDSDQDGYVDCLDCLPADGEVPREDGVEVLGNAKDDNCDDVVDSYTADFDDGVLPAGWELVGGVLRMADGCLVLEGGTDGSPAQVEVPVSGETWQVAVTLHATDATANALYGLSFGRDEEGAADYGFMGVRLPISDAYPEDVWVGFRQPDHTIYLVPGQYRGDLPYDGRGPMRIEIHAQGGQADVYIGGVLLLTVEGQLTTGRLALYSQRASVCFDDLEVH